MENSTLPELLQPMLLRRYGPVGFYIKPITNSLLALIANDSLGTLIHLGVVMVDGEPPQREILDGAGITVEDLSALCERMKEAIHRKYAPHLSHAVLLHEHSAIEEDGTVSVRYVLQQSTPIRP